MLTANKVSSRQYKIVAPVNPEKPIKYVRKPIDYSVYDDIGHGLQAKQKQRNSANVRSPVARHRLADSPSSSLQASVSNVAVGPPPTTKPPTPPQVGRGSTGTLKAGSTGTLGKSSREYRTPPVVIPPQVPSHYAPNFPLGHPRRQQQSERGPGYSAIPVPPSQQIATTVHSGQAPVNIS